VVGRSAFFSRGSGVLALLVKPCARSGRILGSPLVGGGREEERPNPSDPVTCSANIQPTTPIVRGKGCSLNQGACTVSRKGERTIATAGSLVQPSPRAF
jgi:hypothetical protein